MPLYEYECEECGMVSEAIQKFSDVPLQKCIHCSGKLNKLVSNSAFHLKGSGWYVTDYGSGSSKKNQSKKSSKSDKKEKKSSKIESKKER